MARTPRWVCCWPGLPQLWTRGTWSGLLLAVGFAGLLNFVVVASVVWTQWISPQLVLAGWGVLGALCGASIWLSGRGLAAADQQANDELDEQLLREAQTHYLRANWFEAETLLERITDENGRDVDAWMLLASVKRHTGQLDEAEAILERIARLEDGSKWLPEIAREKTLLARRRDELKERDQDDSAAQAESDPAMAAA